MRQSKIARAFFWVHEGVKSGCFPTAFSRHFRAEFYTALHCLNQLAEPLTSTDNQNPKIGLYYIFRKNCIFIIK
jgi:hypothetical protein